MLRKYGFSNLKNVGTIVKIGILGEYNDEDIGAYALIHLYTDSGKNVGDKLDLYGDKRSMIITKSQKVGREKHRNRMKGMVDFVCKYVDNEEFKSELKETILGRLDTANEVVDKFYADSDFRDQKFEEYKTDFLPKFNKVKKTSIVKLVKEYSK